MSEVIVTGREEFPLQNLLHENFRQELISRDAANFRAVTIRLSDVTRAKCMGWTQAFVNKFPELIKVSGFFKTEHQLPDIQGTEHWWLIDVEGTIVDPTRGQFMAGKEIYKVFDPLKDKVYVGKCPNCGEANFGLIGDGPKDICSDECAEDYERYLRTV